MSRTQPPTRSFSTRDDIEPPGGEGTPRRRSAEADAAREIARGYWRAATLLTREGNSSLDVLDKRDVLDDQQNWAGIAATLDGKQRPRTRQLRVRQGQVARWRTPSLAGITAMTTVVLMVGAAGAAVLINDVVRDARRDFLPHITVEPPRRGAGERTESAPPAPERSQPTALPEASAPEPEAAQHNPRLRPGAMTSEPNDVHPPARIEPPDALPPIGGPIQLPTAPPSALGGLGPVLEEVLGLPRGLLNQLEKRLDRGRADRVQREPGARADEARSNEHEPRRSVRSYRVEFVGEEDLAGSLAPPLAGAPLRPSGGDRAGGGVPQPSPPADPPAAPPASEECESPPGSEVAHDRTPSAARLAPGAATGC